MCRTADTLDVGGCCCCVYISHPLLLYTPTTTSIRRGFHARWVKRGASNDDDPPVQWYNFHFRVLDSPAPSPSQYYIPTWSCRLDDNRSFPALVCVCVYIFDWIFPFSDIEVQRGARAPPPFYFAKRTLLDIVSDTFRNKLHSYICDMRLVGHLWNIYWFRPALLCTSTE